MSRMSSNNTRARAREPRKGRTSRWGIYRARRRRKEECGPFSRAQPIQKRGVNATHFEISDRIQFDEPWSLKCASRSLASREGTRYEIPRTLFVEQEGRPRYYGAIALLSARRNYSRKVLHLFTFRLRLQSWHALYFADCISSVGRRSQIIAESN